jgi:hypothetical protein
MMVVSTIMQSNTTHHQHCPCRDCVRCCCSICLQGADLLVIDRSMRLDLPLDMTLELLTPVIQKCLRLPVTTKLNHPESDFLGPEEHRRGLCFDENDYIINISLCFSSGDGEIDWGKRVPQFAEIRTSGGPLCEYHAVALLEATHHALSSRLTALVSGVIDPSYFKDPRCGDDSCLGCCSEGPMNIKLNQQQQP